MDLGPDASSTTDLLHDCEKFLPGFQCPVKWGGRYLSSRFQMSVNKLARVEYPAQGATTCDITESMLMLQIPCWKTRKVHLPVSPGYPRVHPKGCELFSLSPSLQQGFISYVCACPSEGENWLETLS